MRFTPFSSISLLFLAVGAQAQWPAPGPCSGVCSDSHDPSVIRRPDGKYFRFATGDNVTLATATSIAGPWATQPGGVFPSVTSAAAPDIHRVGDLYYLYYQTATFGSNNNSNIHVASSPSMEPNTWTDHGILPLPKHTNPKGIDYNLIDANLLVSEDSKEFHLSWGSYWDGIFQIQLQKPTTIMPGAKLEHLARNFTQRPDKLPPDPIEGSYQFVHSLNGVQYYYLFFSSGTCCQLETRPVPPGEEYKVMVCRAEAPSGPFFDKEGRSCLIGNGGSEILGSHDVVYAPGGQGVYYDDCIGSVILYYHYLVKKSLLVQFGWNKMAFDKGWPVLEETTGSNVTASGTCASSVPPFTSPMPGPSTSTSDGTPAPCTTTIFVTVTASEYAG